MDGPPVTDEEIKTAVVFVAAAIVFTLVIFFWLGPVGLQYGWLR